MTLLLLCTVSLGIIVGKFFIPVLWVPELSNYALWLLLCVLLGIGVELGASHSLIDRLKRLPPKALLLPLTSGLGTLVGAFTAALFLNMGGPQGLSIGAGFGWYSLSSVLIAKLAGAELAALAFLTNVARELIAIPLIPLLWGRNLGVAAITPGGATTMDTTLTVISRVTDPEITLIALYHGVVLSSLTPLLVTLFCRMIK